MSRGWVKLYRGVFDCDALKDNAPYNLRDAWIDILLSVNYEPKEFKIAKGAIRCEPGQCLYSLNTWAKRWRWDRYKVRRFLAKLEKNGMIQMENARTTSVLTVLNWSHFQAKNTEKNRTATATATATDSAQQPQQINDTDTASYEVKRTATATDSAQQPQQQPHTTKEVLTKSAPSVLLSQVEKIKEIDVVVVVDRFEDFKGKILADKMLMESSCLVHKISEKKFYQMVPQFFLTKKGLGKGWEDYTDCKDNFWYWIPKNINHGSDYKSVVRSANGNRTGRSQKTSRRESEGDTGTNKKSDELFDTAALANSLRPKITK